MLWEQLGVLLLLIACVIRLVYFLVQEMVMSISVILLVIGTLVLVVCIFAGLVVMKEDGGT